uniref:Uncharacterized protein n=1 Tax=Romanomermis culicivorax TaxID=13658 RepID=A0A915I7Q0_ROMCU
MGGGGNHPCIKENAEDRMISGLGVDIYNKRVHVNADPFKDVIINGIGEGFAKIDNLPPIFKNMAVGADIDIVQIGGAHQVCLKIEVILCTFPPINMEVNDDTLEVHNDESHVPQEPIRKIVHNTSSYDDKNMKCSLDYETGFVDRTVESYKIEIPCKKAAINKLQKWMATKHAPFDPDAEDQDDANEEL